MFCEQLENNSSFTVPIIFKCARVRPLLKIPSLDRNNLKNYGPVSNLPYLSKILEKVVDRRLEQHLSQNALHKTSPICVQKIPLYGDSIAQSAKRHITVSWPRLCHCSGNARPFGGLRYHRPWDIAATFGKPVWSVRQMSIVD